MITDEHDRRLARRGSGLLAVFNRADVLHAADVHVAERLGGTAGEDDPEVLLALALTVRAVRLGSTCLDLTTVAELPLADADPDVPVVEAVVEAELPWPDVATWTPRVAASPLVTHGVLRFDLGLLYLDRYWREETQVWADLRARLAAPRSEDTADLAASARRIFPDAGYEEQRTAATRAAGQLTTVLTGGPGTGKTATVAGLLALVTERQPDARIALAAPTGKAAARLQESVERELARLPASDRARLVDLRAVTLHRLLGSLQPRTGNRFRHDREHRLPHDVVVVDESSMVSLTMMARLLEALRPDARLVLVGDPGQLSPVEAGAVLADLVDGLTRPGAATASPVTSLLTTHRFHGSIAELEVALRARDVDQVLHVLATGTDVELVDPGDPDAVQAFREVSLAAAFAVTQAAESGDAAAAVRALEAHRLLCAHRSGPYGVAAWNRRVERMLADRTGITHYDEWYAGRPVLVLANDYGHGIYNGDTGVTVRLPDGRLRVVVPTAGELLQLAPTRLSDVQTLYAMTVHKSQGSQAGEVSVVLPPPESPLLSQELLYTAVTRAESRVRVLGTEESVRTAVSRSVQRASGLAQRLSS